MIEFEGKRNGEGRNRTVDAGIFSPSLYRLSYLAMTSERGSEKRLLVYFPASAKSMVRGA